MGQSMFALTGPVMAWGSLGLAVLAICVGTLAVPRWVRSTRIGLPGARMIQAATLLLCALLAVITAGIWVNRSVVAFGTWDDLLAAAYPIQTMQTFGAGASPAVTKVRRSDSAAVPVTGDGDDHLVTIPGSASDVTEHAVVHLPPGLCRPPGDALSRDLCLLRDPGQPAYLDRVLRHRRPRGSARRRGAHAPVDRRHPRRVSR